MRMLTRAVVGGAILTVAVTVLPAQAAPGKGNGGGATVVRSDDGCVLPEPPVGGVVVLEFNESGHAHFVETPSGNTHSHCHGQIPSDTVAPDRAVVLRDVPCATTPPNGTVTPGKAVITPSGRVNTSCHAKSK